MLVSFLQAQQHMQHQPLEEGEGAIADVFELAQVACPLGSDAAVNDTCKHLNTPALWWPVLFGWLSGCLTPPNSWL